ncbi:MAG TPA: hypothetical protein VFH67_05565 [bacterium]|nr:hypothetical protein [bacterium]
MRTRLKSLLVVASIIAAGCQSVTVQVPAEADLQGVKTVAVVASDLPNDPDPVAVLLRSEASSRIRRLLPTLTLVEPTGTPDAVLNMKVVRHGITPVSFRVGVDPQTGRVSCRAWQVASLMVDGSVSTDQTIRWQGLLEAGRRIDLFCLPAGGVVVPGSQGSIDPRLVHDVVDELGRRLAGYARREFRAIQNPDTTPTPIPAPDP